MAVLLGVAIQHYLSATVRWDTGCAASRQSWLTLRLDTLAPQHANLRNETGQQGGRVSSRNRRVVKCPRVDSHSKMGRWPPSTLTELRPALEDVTAW